MDWLNNICWLTDSYKVSHFKQYPPGTRHDYWGRELKDAVLARDGVLVVRPDSGDPPTVFKRPVTDGGKKSKAGRLKLIRDDDGRLRTVRESEEPNSPSLLQTVFENVRVIRQENFADIRQRAAEGL